MQAVDGEHLGDNRQGLANGNLSDNRQGLPNGSLSDNRQALADGGLTPNLQAIPDGLAQTSDEQIFADERMNSLQQNITTVHLQLDLITPKSTWQKLDAFFSARPLTGADADADSLGSSTSAPSQDLKVLATLEGPPNAVGTSLTDGPQPTVVTQEAEAQSNADVAQFNAGLATDVNAFAEAEFNAAGIDGGIRLRTLLLTFGISIPLFGYAYGLIYPTMVCQGPTHQWQKWTPDGESTATKIINDQVTTERHLIQIRRGEINVTNQRFPLYKELNQSNHFAQQTDLGFKGSYSTHTVDQMNYVFEFLRDKSQLNIQSQSAGIRYIDGESGHIEVFSVFKGQCDNRWF
jgi:hypothetical protein